MFKIPKYLSAYISAKSKGVPSDAYFDASTYYSKINYIYLNYMNYVVRPCLAYACGVSDLTVATGLSTQTGKAIVDGAARLVIGDRVFFEGDDETSAFFSDIWQTRTHYLQFLSKAERFKYAGGSSICKINTDIHGKNYLTAHRLDRTLPTFDDNGDIIECVFYISFLTSLDGSDGNKTEYWLTETRRYSEDGEKVVVYKVFSKSSVANSPVLPNYEESGIAYENLPNAVKREIKRFGVTSLNAELLLPYRDGLGVWKLDATASNGCIPDVPFGEPLLFGAKDFLWSLDIVFGGTLVDVLNGEGKILVPKMFLQETLSRLQGSMPGTQFNVTTAELDGYGDESFCYIMPSSFDKTNQSPLPVQFDIRAEKYSALWELYQKEACVRSGFAPTSIFPHLVPDGSAKTAREVSAEENLTRASIKQAHLLDIPVFNRMLQEVAFQEGLNDNIELKLADYIGNKLEYDANMRDNVAAGLTPRDVAVELVNNLSKKDTGEYLEKIEKDALKAAGQFNFDEKDYFGDQSTDSKKEVSDGSEGAEIGILNGEEE